MKCPFCDSSFDAFRDRALHLHRSHGWGLRGSSPRAPAPVSEPAPAELLDVPGKTIRRQWLLSHHFVSMAPAANPTAAIHQSALKRSPKLG